MSATEFIEDVRIAPLGEVALIAFRQYDPPVHEFVAAICPAEEGGFAAIAVHIPGVISEGESEAEAIENIREAFGLMLESCREHGESLPFSPRPTIEPAEDCRFVVVKVDG